MRPIGWLFLFFPFWAAAQEISNEVILQWKHDSLKDVIDTYKKLIKKDRENNKLYYACANAKLTYANFCLKNNMVKGFPYDKAIHAYALITKLDSKKYADTAYYQIGIITQFLMSKRMGTNNFRLGEPYNEFAKAVKLNPNYGAAYYQMAVIDWQSEIATKEAIEFFTKVIELNNSNFVAAAYTGRACCVYKKDLQAACDDWQHAIDLGDENAKTYFKQYCNTIEGNKHESRNK